MIRRDIFMSYLMGCHDMIEQFNARFGGTEEEAFPTKNTEEPTTTKSPRQLPGRQHTQRYVLDILRRANRSLLISEIAVELRLGGIDRSREKIRAVLDRAMEKGWVIKNGSSYLIRPDVREDVWLEENE